MNLVISSHTINAKLNRNKYEDYDLITTIDDLRRLIATTPKIYNTIYVDEDSIGFNSVSLNVFKDTITNGFIDFTKLVYISKQPKEATDQVFKNIFIGIDYEVINIKEINNDIVTDIINGKFGSSLGTTITTYDQIKIDEYIKSKGSDIRVDQELINDTIGDNLGLELIDAKKSKNIINVVAFDNLCASIFASLAFSNLSVNNTVFLMEFNKHNYLSDYMVRLGRTDYTTDIETLDGQKSVILLRDKTIDVSYNTMFDFLYNCTNYDYYIKILNPEEVLRRIPSMYIVLQPTPDNVIKLAKMVSNFKTINYNVVLIYKGFIGPNELTSNEVKQTLLSINKAVPNINSYVMVPKERSNS